jgi:NAD(P)-dependent dehydrogenase (short-subunit alcohol dehydrogenase family)
MNQEMDYKSLSELINLHANNAIVTGGATGIGASIVHRLAEAGAMVMIADMDSESAEKTVQEFSKYGNRVSFIKCDVSREEQVKTMVGNAVKEMGSIHIFVNNAGIYPRKQLVEMNGNDFDNVIAVNLLGTFLCSRYAGEEMIKQKQGGCIINIASIEAVHPSSTGMTAYDASKGGVLMLTKSLARELGPHGIRVNAIAPGAIMTRAITSHVGKQSAEEEKAGLKELKAFMARMALGRMGDADDVARVALFLASEMAGYITGEMIVVDGGYLIS